MRSVGETVFTYVLVTATDLVREPIMVVNLMLDHCKRRAGMNLVLLSQLLVIILLVIELKKVVQSGSQKGRGILDVEVKIENKVQENLWAWTVNPLLIWQVLRSQTGALELLVIKLN